MRNSLREEICNPVHNKSHLVNLIFRLRHHKEAPTTAESLAYFNTPTISPKILFFALAIWNLQLPEYKSKLASGDPNLLRDIREWLSNTKNTRLVLLGNEETKESSLPYRIIKILTSEGSRK